MKELSPSQHQTRHFPLLVTVISSDMQCLVFYPMKLHIAYMSQVHCEFTLLCLHMSTCLRVWQWIVGYLPLSHTLSLPYHCQAVTTSDTPCPGPSARHSHILRQAMSCSLPTLGHCHRGIHPYLCHTSVHGVTAQHCVSVTSCHVISFFFFITHIHVIPVSQLSITSLSHLVT